jgi:hypothetical protein
VIINSLADLLFASIFQNKYPPNMSQQLVSSTLKLSSVEIYGPEVAENGW